MSPNTIAPTTTSTSMMMMMIYKVTLSLLQLYFIMFTFTVERSYCAAPLTKQDDTNQSSGGFLVAETYDFCVQYNPYFLSRPEWLRRATCLHSEWFWILYGSILIGLWNDRIWSFLRPFYLWGLGAKCYALAFYHLMEFTSELPPPNLMRYFVPEGPYLVSIAAILYKLLVLDDDAVTATPQRRHRHRDPLLSETKKKTK